MEATREFETYRAGGAQELAGGLLAMADGDAVLVIGPGFTDLASSDDFAYGDTLTQALENYKAGRLDN